MNSTKKKLEELKEWVKENISTWFRKMFRV